MGRTSILPAMLCAAAFLFVALPVAAQVAGFAEITSPQEGEAVEGLVTIRGTADHPEFAGYQLSFAYDPNPTDTWFPLSDRTDSPVNDDGLALWDTSQITPGTYQIRLTVFTESGTPLTATVSGLSVGARSWLQAPVETETADSALPQAASTAPAATETPSPAEVSSADDADTTLVRILLSGASASAVALVALGSYSLLRPRVRQYVGLLRMRRLRRQQRRQSQDRSR